jgi:hypothetical protein
LPAKTWVPRLCCHNPYLASFLIFFGNLFYVKRQYCPWLMGDITRITCSRLGYWRRLAEPNPAGHGPSRLHLASRARWPACWWGRDDGRRGRSDGLPGRVIGYRGRTKSWWRCYGAEHGWRHGAPSTLAGDAASCLPCILRLGQISCLFAIFITPKV